ncbi:polyamine-modulated factor 1-binding protein 1-like isoform X2 [Corythoichthys intestinalis]|uniref:polyamine-modulated factor 1-binding protein 1-like isoform X2 n=1 Tax=Corythoichthys intestinalis TaxID=161448 RepID=UPI0025A686ED|nr:polyamine-modulated factor 1-binding protein 1-like isoform X2 [Corythoichthys intestinalis]
MESHERRRELWGSATLSSGSPAACIQTHYTDSDVACKLGENALQTEKVESGAKLAYLQSEISCLQSLQKDNMKEIAEKDLRITKLQASILLLQRESVNTRAQLKKSNANVKQLDETTVSLRATQDSLRKTLALKEKQTQQLLEDNALLKDSLARLQSKLQTSECTVSDGCATMDQARDSLNAERQQIQEQSEHTTIELECPRPELTYVDCTAEKKEQSLETLCKKTDDLSAKMADTNGKDSPEADFSLCREPHAYSLELATSENGLQKQQVDPNLFHRELEGIREELKAACLQVEEQREMALIYKCKYSATMEKLHSAQGQVEHLSEELQYSQQKIRESQQATILANEELSELKHRYRDKVGQWESSQEALDQLMDELHVSQNLLAESRQKVDDLESLVCGLQGQVETLKQQKVLLECDLRLYQQSHSHANQDYLSLQNHQQRLQKSCSEQVERLVECEKVILQMKSELERQNQEKTNLKQSLVTSCRAHLNRHGQLEKEVEHLNKEVADLQFEQKGYVTLLKQSDEALQEARQEAARTSGEVDAQREEIQRLQNVNHEEEEKLKRAHREKESLSTQVRQLSVELEELHCKHQTTAQVLAARSQEAKRMAVCLNEARQAQDETSVMARRLELEVEELKKNVQQAVIEKKEAQAQVDTLQSKLAASRSDNDNLRHGNQLIVTNLKQWVAEQKGASEKLAQQMKAQCQVLLNVTDDKIHLQEANDTLKAQVKRLKEMAAGQEKRMGRVKAQLDDLRALQDEKILDEETFIALNLSRLADMQTKLQCNMDAIRTLNQQLKAVSQENKHLRRQLEEERCMCVQVEYASPHTPTTVHLPSSRPETSDKVH